MALVTISSPKLLFGIRAETVKLKSYEIFGKLTAPYNNQHNSALYHVYKIILTSGIIGNVVFRII